MTSTSESSTHSPVETAAVVTHGRVDVHDAVERVRAVAERAGVELVDEPERAQLAVALGGDGTILRTLARLLGTGIPVIGVNFGRVGFLASIAPERLEDDLARVFARRVPDDRAADARGAAWTANASSRSTTSSPRARRSAG